MYYYEHVDGETIPKPDIVVDMAGGPLEYFNSPFVARWWHKANKPTSPSPSSPKLKGQ